MIHVFQFGLAAFLFHDLWGWFSGSVPEGHPCIEVIPHTIAKIWEVQKNNLNFLGGGLGVNDFISSNLLNHLLQFQGTDLIF